MTRMDYLRQSFTLPNKKKVRYPPNLSNEVSVKAIPTGSAKMKATKVKSLKHGDTDLLVGDRLEDIYATLPRRSAPDFYGGGEEVEEVKKPPPVSLDDNFLSVSNQDISSDYGSEYDISFRRSGRTTLYATLRRGKKKLFDKATTESRRSSTSTIISSGTGSLPESPPDSETGSLVSSSIYGTIGKCTSKRRDLLPPWLSETSTSLPATPSLELTPIFREPPPFVQAPASQVGSLEDLHAASDTSSVKSFASVSSASNSTSTYSNPKEVVYLRPSMLGTAPLPASHHRNGNNVYKSAEELTNMCSCRERCQSAGYRVKACKTMEPLWESEGTDQVQLRKTNNKWYDVRKTKHKSCPAFQAHMVAAFEQSLSNMTSRLQHLTATAEQKDSELVELRKTIEALQQQSAEAGLTKAALQSMQAVQRTLHSQPSSAGGKGMPRQLSNDSMSSINSGASGCSQMQTQGGQMCSEDKKSKKKKPAGWLRSSFGKAFSRGGGKSCDEGGNSDSSVPNSPLISRSCPIQEEPVSISPARSLPEQEKPTEELVEQLRKQLRDKDMVLTDIRLEALSSAHQLDNMKDLVTKIKSENAQLKSENERLSRLLTNNSENSSQCSIPSLLNQQQAASNSSESIEKRLSSSDQSGSPTVDMYLNDNITETRDSKKIPVSVHLGISGEYGKLANSNEVFIGFVAVGNRTSWTLLDAIVRKAFKEYVLKIDPASNLGLSAESVQFYHIGEMLRSKDLTPELLPCGYLVGNDMQIKLVVKGTSQSSLDAMAFDTLIPKSILTRYVSLLSEHKRIILCGPSGTGKTFLAQRLAEYLVARGPVQNEEAIATFNVDRSSQSELKGYLNNIAEQSEQGDIPQVIIVDSLHNVNSLSDVFNGFLHVKSENCPYIIGTMNQARCSTTNLQLNHNFRWVLCANHMEPVKGLLGRCLRRRLIDHEARMGFKSSNELQQVIEWMPNVWMHINKFLETHNSADATIGPRLFLSCPVDVLSAQVWFTDLWNYTVVPYLIEAVKEGMQLYGQRASWEDPVEWIEQSYPFEHKSRQELVSVRQEDITNGDGAANSNRDSDPLLNMLMRLQEAASYSPQTSINESATECN